MITDGQVNDIAFAAFQTHYKCTIINNQVAAETHWRDNPNTRTLWLGLTKGVIENTFLMMKDNVEAQANPPEPKANPVGDLARRIADQTRQGQRGPDPARLYAGAHTGRTLKTHAEAAAGVVPGLAIGRCTEPRSDPSNTDEDRTTDNPTPSEPAGDA